MKILFAAQNFNMGGIQQALANTCKAICRDYPEHSIDIFTFSGGELASAVPSNIKIKKARYLLNLLLTPIRDLKAGTRRIDLLCRYAMIAAAKLIGIENLYRILFRFEKLNEKYDIAISYFNDVETGVSNRGTDWYVADFVNADKKIAWIHNDPEKMKFNKSYCIKKYKKFDKIACVSQAVKDKFDKLIPEFNNKTCVVYNVFPVQEILKKADECVPFIRGDKFNIISVGRIDNLSKRMDRMVRISSMLKESGINNFKWRIIGDGPDIEKNKKMAEEMGVLDVLSFEGQQNNPYPWVKNSDLFVLTSAYEGYPMVLGEALILGVPIVTTSFAAANEMVTDDNGIVTEMDEAAVFKAIQKLIMNREEYFRLKKGCNSNCVNKQWKSQIEYIL